MPSQQPAVHLPVLLLHGFDRPRLYKAGEGLR